MLERAELDCFLVFLSIFNSMRIHNKMAKTGEMYIREEMAKEAHKIEMIE